VNTTKKLIVTFVFSNLLLLASMLHQMHLPVLPAIVVWFSLLLLCADAVPSSCRSTWLKKSSGWSCSPLAANYELFWRVKGTALELGIDVKALPGED
jgi:hypothetical protein